MQLSVIIPTWNEEANVAAAVVSAFAGGADEVLVVDGGSEDDTVDRAAQTEATVLESLPGRGPQQNAGAARARGDMLLFLHADCRLGEGAKQAIAASGQTAGCFYQSIPLQHPLTYLLIEGNAFRAWRGRPYGDQAIWVSRDRFDAAGGFPDWPLMEEVELCRRLGLGWNTRIVREPPVEVSPRRWETNGVIRQTLLNTFILNAWRCGVSPERLARWYDALRKKPATGAANNAAGSD